METNSTTIYSFKVLLNFNDVKKELISMNKN